MVHDPVFTPATDADVRDDMANHRQTYRGFLTLLKWVAAVSAVTLVVVYLLLSSIDVSRPPAYGRSQPAVGAE